MVVRSQRGLSLESAAGPSMSTVPVGAPEGHPRFTGVGLRQVPAEESPQDRAAYKHITDEIDKHIAKVGHLLSCLREGTWNGRKLICVVIY